MRIQIGSANNTNNPGGKKGKTNIPPHPGLIKKKLTRTMLNNFNCWILHGKSCRNYTKGQLDIEYHILDGMSVSNRNFVIEIKWPPFWIRHFQNHFLVWPLCHFDKWLNFSPGSIIFPRGPINNTVELVQIMVWCGTGDRSLSEVMMTRLTDVSSNSK